MAATLDFTKPHVLRDEAEYEAALAEVERLLKLHPKRGTEASERLDFLALLVEKYEDEHYPMGETSTPQSIVDYVLEARGMQRSDLNDIMGGKSRVSEFFSGKRPLSIGQIKALHDELGISPELLLDLDR